MADHKRRVLVAAAEVDKCGEALKRAIQELYVAAGREPDPELRKIIEQISDAAYAEDGQFWSVSRVANVLYKEQA